MSSPSEQRRHIVITGIGPVSCLGVGREAFWSKLKAGESGIGPIQIHKGVAAPGDIGGEARDFSEEVLKKKIFKEKEQKKAIKVMCREVQMGTAAAMLAIEDSRLDMEAVDRSRVGIEYGANLMLFPPDSMAAACKACVDEGQEFDFNRWGDKGIGSMEPLWMLKYLPNMPACHIAIFLDARGPNNSLTLDEASPGTVLTESLNIMERSAADVMVVGGTGTRIAPTRAIHARLWEELAYNPENPAASCKPFDKNRSGQVVAEGAMALILEEEQHARNRGATIYGRLLGGASSCVADSSGKADVRAAVRNAFNSALKRSGVDAQQLGHINANGLGTHADDLAEAQAIRDVLGEAASQVPVTSLKGFMGNPGAAGGLAEIAASLLTLQEGYIPQTLNCTEPDPELGLDVVTSPRPTKNKLFAKISFARCGQASVVIVEGA